jgi:hypothetical protein
VTSVYQGLCSPRGKTLGTRLINTHFPKVHVFIKFYVKKTSVCKETFTDVKSWKIKIRNTCRKPHGTKGKGERYCSLAARVYA